MKKLALWVGTALLAVSSNAQAAGIPTGKTLASTAVSSLSEAQLRSATAKAIPMEKRLSAPPAGVFTTALSPTFPMTTQPGMVPGSGPSIATKVANPGPPSDSGNGALTHSGDGGIGAQNYGFGRFGSVYQFTDSFVQPYTNYPFRASGWFYFTDYANRTFRCTATLISASIAITAGHCVHDQFAHGAAGWIKSGWFAPAYYNGTFPYGYAWATFVNTTGGWYASGGLDAGYDVGIITLAARAGTSNPIGAYTGWQGFCYSGCLTPAWYLTQIGYPYNLYSGNYQIQGEHLEIGDGRDYVFGSGQLGGSSGGPNSANLGYLSDTSVNTGQWPYRNNVFAVTSWGYDCTDASCTTAQKNSAQGIKIQGASTLSGPGNANNFPAIWNSACARARSQFGAGTCGLF